MSQPLTIRRILNQVKSGAIRIPSFQRGFVWDPDQAQLDHVIHLPPAEKLNCKKQCQLIVFLRVSGQAGVSVSRLSEPV